MHHLRDARFPEVAPNPHHWVRMAAGSESWNGSGRANTVPPGGASDIFVYTIRDGDGDQSTTTLTIEVTDSIPSPSAVPTSWLSA